MHVTADANQRAGERYRNGRWGAGHDHMSRIARRTGWRLLQWAVFRLLDRGKAQAYIRDCRSIHEQWSDYLLRHPDYESSQVGGVPHHRKWVQRYNFVLGVLR